MSAFYPCCVKLTRGLKNPGFFIWLNKHMDNQQPEQPIRQKPGPNGEPRWGEKIVKGIVVGRNKIVVPPEDVEHFASLGCSDREIAQYFGVKEDTLRYNFADYLTKGRHNLKVTLRQAQLRTALEGNATLLIWLGKNILQQTDNGIFSEEVKPLPWSDTFDSDVIELDNSDELIEEEHKDNAE
jgi:hypothetical protein